MRQRIGWWVAIALTAATPALACDNTTTVEVQASEVLTRAVNRLREEQRAGLQAQAERVLAQLRSESATAVAQGTTVGAGTQVKGAP